MSNSSAQVNNTFHYAIGYQISFGIINGLVMFCGAMGNALVLVVLAMRRRERSFGDRLVMAMSISDLLCSLAGPVLSFSILFFVYLPSVYGKFVCYWIQGILMLAIAASSYLLAAMSLNRKRIISEPGQTTKLKSVAIIASLWLWACCLVAPYMVASALSGNQCLHDFSLQRTLWRGFQNEFTHLLIFALLAATFPAAVAAAGFLLCKCELRKNEERYASSVSQWKRYRENQRIVNMFVIITFFSTVSSLAYLIFGVVTSRVERNDDGSHTKHREGVLLLYVSLLTLLSVRSVLAPLIYVRMHREIRHSLKHGWRKVNRTSLRVFRLTVVRERSSSRRVGTLSDLATSTATISTMEENC